MQASRWLWNLSQRRALIALATLAWAWLLIRSYQNPVFIGDTPPESHVALAAIDPNTATAAVLSTIPRLGPTRAAAIVAYRREYQKLHPGSRAFARPEDLLNVRGIGPATVEAAAKYWSFRAAGGGRSN